jgi:hypothetical protein
MDIAATVSASDLFKKEYSFHPKFQQAFDAVDRLLVNREDENSCLFVVGQPGVGKTFFTKRLLNMKTEIQKDRDCKFAIRVEVSFEKGITGLVEDLLIELGDLAPEKGSTPSKRRRVLRLVDQLNIQVIIIDEVHGILPSSGLTAHSPSVKLIKSLLNNTKASLLLCGKDTALRLRNDIELDDRCDTDIIFTSFSCRGAECRFDFIEYLLDILKGYPSKVEYLDCVYRTLEDEKLKLLDITEYHNLHRFLAATKGNPRRIRRLLCGALEIAGAGEPITKLHLSQVWEERLRRGAKEANPFKQNYKLLIEQLADKKVKLYA